MSLVLWLLPAITAVAGTIALVVTAQSMGDETKLLRAELLRVASAKDDIRALRDQLRGANRA